MLDRGTLKCLLSGLVLEVEKRHRLISAIFQHGVPLCITRGERLCRLCRLFRPTASYGRISLNKLSFSYKRFIDASSRNV
jgi:hypothetical protein